MTTPKQSFMHGSKASSYIIFNTSQDLPSAYLKYLEDAEKLMLDAPFGMSAIIYTELQMLSTRYGTKNSKARRTANLQMSAYVFMVPEGGGVKIGNYVNECLRGKCASPAVGIRFLSKCRIWSARMAV